MLYVVRQLGQRSVVLVGLCGNSFVELRIGNGELTDFAGKLSHFGVEFIVVLLVHWLICWRLKLRLVLLGQYCG